MGEELTRKPEQLTGKDQGSTDPGGNHGGTGGQAGADSRPGTATAATAGTGGTGGTPAGGKAEKEVSGLVDVTTAPAPAKPKKAQRKKAKPKAKKADDKPLSQEQLSALFVGMSGIVASRPGFEVWAITQQEADQLAKPLASMIEKSEKLAALGEHADAVALTMAAVMIFAPRAMAFSAQQKAARIAKNGGVAIGKPNGKKPKSGGSSKPANGGDNVKSPAPSETPVSFSEILAPVL